MCSLVLTKIHHATAPDSQFIALAIMFVIASAGEDTSTETPSSPACTFLPARFMARAFPARVCLGILEVAPQSNAPGDAAGAFVNLEESASVACYCIERAELLTR